MGVVSKILENTVSTIEALTPVNDPGKRYEGLKQQTADDARVAGAGDFHRKFQVSYTDVLTIDDSFPWAAETDIEYNRVIELAMIHRIPGRDVHEAAKYIAEDVDQIIEALLRVENYVSAQDTDGALLRRDIVDGPLTEFDRAKGAAHTELTFVVKYQRRISA